MKNNFSEEDLKLYKSLNKSFLEKLESVLTSMENVKTGKSFYKGEIRTIEFKDDIIEVITYEESRCSCCSGEYYDYIVPNHYMYDENWLDDYKKLIHEENIRQQKLKEEMELKKRKEKEQKERELYEKLREKFS